MKWMFEFWSSLISTCILFTDATCLTKYLHSFWLRRKKVLFYPFLKYAIFVIQNSSHVFVDHSCDHLHGTTKDLSLFSNTSTWCQLLRWKSTLPTVANQLVIGSFILLLYSAFFIFPAPTISPFPEEKKKKANKLLHQVIVLPIQLIRLSLSCFVAFSCKASLVLFHCPDLKPLLQQAVNSFLFLSIWSLCTVRSYGFNFSV